MKRIIILFSLCILALGCSPCTKPDDNFRQRYEKNKDVYNTALSQIHQQYQKEMFYRRFVEMEGIEK